MALRLAREMKMTLAELGERMMPDEYFEHLADLSMPDKAPKSEKATREEFNKRQTRRR